MNKDNVLNEQGGASETFQYGDVVINTLSERLRSEFNPDNKKEERV